LLIIALDFLTVVAMTVTSAQVVEHLTGDPVYGTIAALGVLSYAARNFLVAMKGAAS
jgi:hypothetical protein